MRRAIVAVGALAIVGILLVLFVAPAFTPGFGGNMSVQLYKDGVPVGLPLAWTANGVEVNEFGVTVTWQVEASDFKLDTLYVDGLMEVYDVIEYGHEGPVMVIVDTHSWVSQNPSGSEEHMWYFANILDTSAKSEWELRIYGHLEGQAEDVYGQHMDDACDLGYVTMIVTWVLDQGTFSITGGIGF